MREGRSHSHRPATERGKENIGGVADILLRDGGCFLRLSFYKELFTCFDFVLAYRSNFDVIVSQ